MLFTGNFTPIYLSRSLTAKLGCRLNHPLPGTWSNRPGKDYEKAWKGLPDSLVTFPMPWAASSTRSLVMSPR